jgi:hypothetical protein
MKLYNVRVSVVDLVWANSDTEAVKTLRARLDGRGFSPYEEDDYEAFVSEPVESKGWAGE